jgi:hypothetical protein
VLWIRIWSGRIHIIFRSWIRIRFGISVKRWIRIRIKVKIQKLQRLKIESWRGEYDHNEGLEAQYGALEGPFTSSRKEAGSGSALK